MNPWDHTSTYLGIAWHGWYHVVGNTYGTWLHGDERGCRTRHHRNHIEGDYKNPPPQGVYDALRDCSKRAMNRQPVILTKEARKAACKVFADTLCYHHIQIVDLAITSQHYHVLARFPCTKQWLRLMNGEPGNTHGLKSVGFNRYSRAERQSALDDPPRHFIGIAKKMSSRWLSKYNLVAPGGIWAKRCKPIPIENRKHQLHTAQYIRNHIHENAEVLSILRKSM